jgi:hypothetical protein
MLQHGLCIIKKCAITAFSVLLLSQLTFYHMSILWKMAVFLEKPPVTSSNCYETIKNASILKFPVTMAYAGRLKITILHYFFPSKLISKCCNFPMHWERVKDFSALVTRYLKIDLRPFLACHMSKIFLAMRGTAAPLQTPKQKGAHSPSANPLMYHCDGGLSRKSDHFFLQHFSNEKQCFGPK